MAIFNKTVESNGTWRLVDANGALVGRIWNTAHIDRILRDGDLAEEMFLAASRSDVSQAIDQWQLNGGRSVDFSILSHSLNNDAGQPDGNIHLYLGGQHIGYFHGEGFNSGKVLRFARLGEEIQAAIDIEKVNTRNEAIDAAIQRMKDDGGLD